MSFRSPDTCFKDKKLSCYTLKFFRRNRTQLVAYFIPLCDICGAWPTFGGIAAQFNHLSIVLRLATVENIASALLYDSLLSAHLEELARARAEKSSETVDFAQLLSVEQTRFRMQVVSQDAKPIQPAKEVDLKDKPKGKPSAPKADWLPKEEYKAKICREIPQGFRSVISQRRS